MGSRLSRDLQGREASDKGWRWDPCSRSVDHLLSSIPYYIIPRPWIDRFSQQTICQVNKSAVDPVMAGGPWADELFQKFLLFCVKITLQSICRHKAQIQINFNAIMTRSTLDNY